MTRALIRNLIEGVAVVAFMAMLAVLASLAPKPGHEAVSPDSFNLAQAR